LDQARPKPTSNSLQGFVPKVHTSREPLEGGPVQVAAAVAAVIVVLRQRPPALLGLAGDIGQCGFPLGIQGVEFLLQALLRRFARVDGTAHRLGGADSDKR
jgi:hypothetical protein